MIAHPVNRVFGYLAEQAAPPPPAPPTGEKEREAYWNETFFQAVAVLKQQLSSSSESVRSRAAHKLIDLERTKLRHGRRLDGTGEAPPPRPSRRPRPT